jgi:hypothetical protein
LEIFAVDFVKVTSGKLTLRFDDTAPLRIGHRLPRARFATGTFRLSYNASSDGLTGKLTGPLKGKLEASRMMPDRPLQRLWQATFRAPDGDVFVQLATTENAEGVLGGHATFNGETATVAGEVAGNAVSMDFDLGDQTITFTGKLKTRNNKLQGSFRSEGSTSKVTLVPADGDGRPMKFKSVQRLAAVELVPGQSTTVLLNGRNIAQGALAFTDRDDVRVSAVELQSTKQLQVTLLPSSGIPVGASVAVRLLNADGETVDRSNALTVPVVDTELVDFELQIAPIFTTSCAVAGCHSNVGPKAGLVLTAAAAINNLVNVPSSQQPGLLRVRPGNPTDSYLVRKLEGGPGISGARMPKSRAPLPDAQIALIRQWISQGALRTAGVPR